MQTAPASDSITNKDAQDFSTNPAAKEDSQGFDAFQTDDKEQMTQDDQWTGEFEHTSTIKTTTEQTEEAKGKE